jgi:hypothetical protein
MAARRISLDEVDRLRARRWRTAPQRQIASERGASRFISELGFVLLMPIAGADLPSIRDAARSEWDWWDWKQTLPERRACYYAKLIRRRGTFVSWDWFPVFYAAFADPRPYWRQYRAGLLDRAEKHVLDILADRGPLMTTDLRLAFGPRSKQNTRRVKGILVELQRRFLIAPVGGDTDGWSHHRWHLVDRWVPARLLAEAGRLPPQEARATLLAKFVDTVLVATPADIAWALGWQRREVQSIAARLLAEGVLEPAHLPQLAADVLIPHPWPGRRS